jgi:putative transposase
LRRLPEPKQYTSAEYRRLLDDNHITQSLSRPRQCWDNAVAEAWFGTLKTELIDHRSWATRTQARHAVFEFIEVFYNRQRLHSSLGYLSPAEYEARQIHQHPAAQAA